MFCNISVSFPNLGIKIENMPVGFTIFGFEVAIYGIIIGIGVLAGMAIAFREAKKTGQNIEHYMDLALYGIIFSITGARLYYVIFEWDYFSAHPFEIINIRQGGLAIYGAVIAAIITAVIVSKIHKLNFFKVADTACLGLLLGQIIGRWGNFFNREAFGGDTNSLFAMRINTNDGIVRISAPAGVHYIEGTKFIQVHPTFLYESAWNLMLLILILIFRKYKKSDGEVFAWYLGGYGFGRFFIESMRSDQLIMPFFKVPVSQIVSVIIFAFAVSFCITIRCRKGRS